VIPALLGGGEAGYGAAAVPLRAAHYAGNLGGAGLAFFALLFGSRLGPRIRRGCAAGRAAPPGSASWPASASSRRRRAR
jgi:hypothetical protein